MANRRSIQFITVAAFTAAILALALVPGTAHPSKQLANKIDTALIRFGVMVTDEAGHFVPNLRHDAFTLYEDGVEQEIVAFRSDVDSGCSISLVVDTFSFKRGQVGPVSKAALDIIRLARNNDEIALIQTGPEPQILQPFTSDKRALEDTISRLEPSEGANLIDAIAVAADYARKQGKQEEYRRKAVVILTDGAGKIGEVREQKLEPYFRQSARVSGTEVYLVAFTSTRLANKESVTRLAGNSFGSAFFVGTWNELGQSVAQLITEIQAPYMLFYYPTDDRLDGTFRRVRIEARDKDRHPLRVFARDGYWAPSL